MTELGAELERLCIGAKDSLLLVAPFITFSPFSHLIQNLSPAVALTCVTRWRLDEIALGVSDPNIWRLIQMRDRSALFVRNDLHAKYYRADDICLVGSANITDAALGWSNTRNYELLIEVSSNNSSIQDFEASLFDGAIEVTESIYERICVEKEKFIGPNQVRAQSREWSNMLANQPEDLTPTNSLCWLPNLRHPEKLFQAYSHQINDLTETAIFSSIRDLEYFNPPLGLNESSFNAFIRSALLITPMIRIIDDYLIEPRRFGEVRALLSQSDCAQDPDFDAAIAWQTTMRWLIFFFPNRYTYSIPGAYSEVVTRVK